MKLKKYNAATLPQRTTHITQPIVSFSKSVIRFNTSARQLLGLAENTKVQFLQDEDSKNKADWYIEVGAPDGFEVRAKARSVESVYFGHRQLCEAIKDSLGQSGTIIIPIGEKDANGYYPLITRAAKKRA